MVVPTAYIIHASGVDILQLLYLVVNVVHHINFHQLSPFLSQLVNNWNYLAVSF
jgi:hypothetical protein